MQNILTEREEVVDGMPRDARGFWQPEDGTADPNPFLTWPLKPKEALIWLKDYIYPWNLIYAALATLTWYFLTPDLTRTSEFRWDWILQVFLRNQVMLIVIVSAWHIWLWVKKSQGLQYKYTSDWMGAGKRQFLWNNQVRDNVFWSCVSGGITWTAYEVLMLWAYGRGIIPYLDPAAGPLQIVWFVLILVAVPLFRLFHFYWVHRLLHWPPLYKAGHYLHHKNINIGPWSGLAMHPIEHILYYSCILIHWVVPSHPIHMILNAQHASFTPAQGHVGFEHVMVGEKGKIPAGSYFHQLHHRYFECNYGEPDIPFDLWFGTSHDGSAEAHEQMRAKRRAVHNV